MIAQSPASTEYGGMPRSAIATGLVDFELPPADMAAQLITYAARAFGPPPKSNPTSSPNAENALQKAFVVLRSRTGHDFSGYKPSTVHRRMARRMAVHQVDTLDRYVQYARQTPGEVDALFRDLLIGVTSFFRDPVAFAALEEQVVPGLFVGKSPGATIRVWSPGCSTGEEAYSLAILLAERQEILRKSFTVQVFATDIDAEAIATARGGLCPASIAGDLSPERLARFFVADPEGRGYRIHRGDPRPPRLLRAGRHQGPPFGRLDLISCRNLLIYLGGELQKKLIPLFHYALNPDGALFLGTSETVGEFEELFAVVDSRSKLYRRKGDLHVSQRVAPGRFLVPVTATAATAPALRAGAPKPAFAVKLPLRELTEQALLAQAAPAAALVDGAGDILYLHGHTGMDLEPAPGEPGISNLLKMAREGLRHELIVALHKARETKAPVRCPGLRARTNGGFTLVNLTIRPVTTGPSASLQAPLYLVVLEEAPPSDATNSDRRDPGGPGSPPPGSGDRSLEAAADLDALRQELRAKEEYLQTANEELETSNEELESANEEMQSVNEELATINVELRTTLAELSRTNNDLNNLIGGTGIGTVFVDHRQRILRFTPTTTRTINLILSDVGRPIGHLVPNLVGYDSLVADTQAVLDTLIPREVEVQIREGSWCRLQIRPDRTRMITKSGSVVEVSITSTALVDEDGKMYAIATTERARAPEPGSETERARDVS